MKALADAAIESILYLSLAPDEDERADADGEILESLVATLQSSSPEELGELRAALERSRVAARAANRLTPELLESFRVIETDIFGDPD